MITWIRIVGAASSEALMGLLGALGGVLGTLALGVGKQKNESAQVAINGLQALVVQQQATIARLEARVKDLEERLEQVGK